jgi:hypothetical protein
MKRVRLTVVAIEKQEVLHILCVCRLSCPARNAYAPYNIFVYDLSALAYLMNGTVLGKKLLQVKCVFSFSLQLFLKDISF